MAFVEPQESSGWTVGDESDDPDVGDVTKEEVMAVVKCREKRIFLT